MNNDHPWLITGPWYRWHDPSQSIPPSKAPESIVLSEDEARASRPLIQKYASPDFIDEFLQNPQRSLYFNTTDLVYTVSTQLTGRKPQRQVVSPRRRKLFLNSHSRFYTVACELHCDIPGLPVTGRDQVCEAGFVVRRRRVVIPATSEARRQSFEDALRRVGRTRYRLQKLLSKTMSESNGLSFSRAIRKASAAACSTQLETLKNRLEEERCNLKRLACDLDVSTQIERWIPTGKPGYGCWRATNDEEASINAGAAGNSLSSQSTDDASCHEEHVFPLYPLIPDPTDPDHSSEGRSIWFGVVPTGSEDIDQYRSPRFDDRSIYEIRCFVRRHESERKRTNRRHDCCGEIVWSPATEPYQLASHFDLDGTGHRITTVQLPDLKALEAQVLSDGFQMGNGVGVGMVSPPESELSFANDSSEPFLIKASGRTPSTSICFFAIPLITIVAMFLLRLFLPIVVFLFQLWFLLLLRFCIPPSFSISADMSAELDADMDFELDADIDLSAELKAGFEPVLPPGATVGDAVESALNALPADIATDIRTQLQQGQLTKEQAAQMILDLSSDFSQSVPSLEGMKAPETAFPRAERSRELPDLQGQLIYYKRVRIREAA